MVKMLFMNSEGMDLMHLKEVFGGSSEFIKRLQQNKIAAQKQGSDWETLIVQREAEHLASCNYENATRWGEEVLIFLSFMSMIY